MGLLLCVNNYCKECDISLSVLVTFVYIGLGAELVYSVVLSFIFLHWGSKYRAFHNVLCDYKHL